MDDVEEKKSKKDKVIGILILLSYLVICFLISVAISHFTGLNLGIAFWIVSETPLFLFALWFIFFVI
jgi:hypothetical protein